MLPSLMLVLANLANAVYFYSEPEKWSCFRDTVVANYVSIRHRLIPACRLLRWR